MKLFLLDKLDDLIHFLIPQWMPYPVWAWRICNAYERALTDTETEN